MSELSSLTYLMRRWRRRLRIAPPIAPLQECVMGMQIEYDPRTDIGRRLYFDGGFERGEIEFCNSIIASASEPTVVDIGANIGLHSVYWAARNPALRCSLFEPSSTTAKVLRKNIAMNGVEDRVRVIEMAVSNAVGEAAFYECSDGAFSSLKDTGRKPVVAETRVAVTTLDSWVESQKFRSLDLVKIDVEGFEHEVILGADAVLRLFKPHLFVEIFGGQHSNQHPEKTVELICGYGYEAFVFGRDGRRQPYVAHSDRNYNYYFAPQ